MSARRGEDVDPPAKRRKVRNIAQAYQRSSTAEIESIFTKETVGLVSQEEYVKKKKELQELLDQPRTESKEKRKARQKTVQLSFEDEEAVPVTKVTSKDPTADTRGLFDAQRAADLEEKKKELVRVYAQEQERSKEETVAVPFMYYDGSGKQDVQRIKKGASVAKFLESHPGCLAVKDDVILPINYTIYDMDRLKQVGRNQNVLFRFQDDNGELRDTGPIMKIVSRTWYENNRHIFPANRWEYLK